MTCTPAFNTIQVAVDSEESVSGGIGDHRGEGFLLVRPIDGNVDERVLFNVS